MIEFAMTESPSRGEVVMSLRKVVVEQFGKPHGFLGRMAGWIMAWRPSNRERNHWTVDLLNIQSGDRFIEIGCGPGIALEDCLAGYSKHAKMGKLFHSRQSVDESAIKRRA